MEMDKINVFMPANITSTLQPVDQGVISKFKNFSVKKCISWDLPGSPVVETSPSNARGAGSIPGQGAKIPHASQHMPKNQNIKQKQYCNKLSKDF